MQKIGLGFILGLGVFQVSEAADLYLPMTDPVMPWVERLAEVSSLPSLKKPYALADVRRAANEVARLYPRLSRKVIQGVSHYDTHSQLSHIKASVQYTTRDKTSPLYQANANGMPTTSYQKVTVTGVWLPKSYAKVMLSSQLIHSDSEADFRWQESYAALGNSQFQLDIGQRDHWFSANKFDGYLISNNAENPMSLTLSNHQAWTGLGLRWELFLARLGRHNGIRLENTSSSGNPYVSGAQLQIQPTPKWGISLNRSFMFGGGDRAVGGRDFLEAFFNPEKKDNVGIGNCSGSSPNCEFGNQQMSIESQLKLSLSKNFPVVFNAALAAEDTERGSFKYIGNALMSLGVSLPMVTQKLSMAMQYSEWEGGWYVHHIYPDGYTNEGRVLGAFWGDLQQSYRGTLGNQWALEGDYFLPNNSVMTLQYRWLVVKPTMSGVLKRQNLHWAKFSWQEIPVGKMQVGLSTLWQQSFNGVQNIGIQGEVQF